MVTAGQVRRGARVRSQCPVVYSVTRGDRSVSATSHATTLDLSVVGVRLEVDRRLAVGDTLDLEIAIGRDTIRTRARVVYLHQPAARSFSLEAGAEFFELDDQARSVLQSLVASAAP